ncbi:MAG: peptidoglycan-binding protein [Parasporobacterium sp.]|nr:peptidoglycan-binding protein [Parasporobacterium sp.]
MRKIVVKKIVVLSIIAVVIFGCSNAYASTENEDMSYPETYNASTYNPYIYVLICQYGDQNLDVSFLQRCLHDIGYYNGSIDGAFGNMTYNAVCNYQTAKNLDVDGVCGPATWRAILTTYVYTCGIHQMASVASGYNCFVGSVDETPGIFYLKVGNNDYVIVRYAV